MPIRIKHKALAAEEPPSPTGHGRFGGDLPDIGQDDSFRDVVKKMSIYMTQTVAMPSTFEQLRTTSAGDCLRELVEHLGERCNNAAIVNALLALKWHYGAAGDDKAVNEARAGACEIVAWRFLTHLSEREAVNYCLYEIPAAAAETGHTSAADEEAGENSPLLTRAWQNTANSAREWIEGTGSGKRYRLLRSLSRLTMSTTLNNEPGDSDGEVDPTAPFVSLNALEIAAVASAKRFLSQPVVQNMVTGIWNGDIVFWDHLSVNTTKKPRLYNPQTADPFSRLRVPKYLKSFEVLFFCSFLVLYYAVLAERDLHHITTLELWLYVWIAAYLYDELSEWLDAGSIFYAADVWNLFDMIMISISMAFAVLRIVGFYTGDTDLSRLAFDIFALEALFMVPRVCSILSLSPYWGTLIPCLEEMGKDFVKFMVLVVIIYLGFLSTFTLVGKDHMARGDMALDLTKIFFGGSSTGFEIMDRIDPVFGPPLMVVFITLSSILLMGSLTGMLSNSFSRVITHAREEYLFVYSVYVLEASTSNRLTHFYPPLNLVALVVFRPPRLFMPASQRFRAARIVLLKVTHLPVVAVIMAYERVSRRLRRAGTLQGPRSWAAPRAAVLAVRGNNRTSPARRGTAPLYHISATPPLCDRTNRPRADSLALLRHQESMQARPPSGSGAAPTTNDNRKRQGRRQVAEAKALAAEDSALGQEASDLDIRIAELTSKIDRLTELVVRLEAATRSRPRMASDVAV